MTDDSLRSVQNISKASETQKENVDEFSAKSNFAGHIQKKEYVCRPLTFVLIRKTAPAWGSFAKVFSSRPVRAVGEMYA